MQTMKNQYKENPYWILWNMCDQLQDSIGLFRDELRKHNVPEEILLELNFDDIIDELQSFNDVVEKNNLVEEN